jgi:hypothetical protein
VGAPAVQKRARELQVFDKYSQSFPLFRFFDGFRDAFKVFLIVVSLNCNKSDEATHTACCEKSSGTLSRVNNLIGGTTELRFVSILLKKSIFFFEARNKILLSVRTMIVSDSSYPNSHV